MGAAEVQGIGAVALVDLVEHAVEGFVLVVGVEQVARDLAVFDEVGEGDADLEDGCQESLNMGHGIWRKIAG